MYIDSIDLLQPGIKAMYVLTCTADEVVKGEYSPTFVTTEALHTLPS